VHGKADRIMKELLKRLSDKVEVNTIHFGHGPKFRLENIHDDRRTGPGSFPYRQMVAKPQIPLEPNKMNSISFHSNPLRSNVLRTRGDLRSG
jgi:hypothetical protein